MRRKYRLVTDRKKTIEKEDTYQFQDEVDPAWTQGNISPTSRALNPLEEEGDGGGAGGDSGTGEIRPDSITILVEETEVMANQQRALVQKGHRSHAKVNVRHKPQREAQGNEAGEQFKSHPILKKTQQLDGVDNTLASNPLNSQEAKTELENQLRNQHQKSMDKQAQAQLSGAPSMRAG